MRAERALRVLLEALLSIEVQVHSSDTLHFALLNRIDQSKQSKAKRVNYPKSVRKGRGGLACRVPICRDEAKNRCCLVPMHS